MFVLSICFTYEKGPPINISVVLYEYFYQLTLNHFKLTLRTILLVTFGYTFIIKFYFGIGITMWHKYFGANTSFGTIFFITDRKSNAQTYNDKKTNIFHHND